jgi:N6-L-threonylcarbamoyladenine synthase
MKNEDICVEDVAASFQQAVVDVIVSRTMLAAKEYNVENIALAGGVAANSGIRKGMEKACKDNGYNLYYPSIEYCTDNAAMIGSAAYYEYVNGTRHGLDLNAIPNLKIGERR